MKVSVKLTIAASVLALGLGSAQANNLFGVDVSSYQGSITWSGVYGDGARYAFAKATEGTYYIDAYFSGNMSHGKSAGMQMGAYHFARPDTTCPSSQANYFWNKAGSTIVADGHSIFPMVDFETFNGVTCVANYTAWFNSWSSDVKAKTSHFLHPVIYCSAGSGACDLIEFDKTGGISLSAFIANYNGENLYTGNPWSCCTCCNAWQPNNQCGGSNWTYWQVSSTGRISGISGNCDFDAYASTLANLVSWQGVH